MGGVRIPVYQQTQTPQGAVLPIGDMPRNRTAEAVANVGQAVSGIAKMYEEKLDRDAQVEAKRRAADLEAQTLVTLDEQSRTLGDADPTGFAGRINDAVGKTFDGALQQAGEDANPYLRKHLDDALQNVRRNTFVRSMGVEEKALSQWSKSQADNMADSMWKVVQIDPTQFSAKVAEFGEAVDKLSGFDQGQKAEAKARFASGAALQSFDRELSANPSQVLKTIEAGQDPRVAALSADDQKSLLSSARTEVERQRARAEREVAKQEAKASRELDKLQRALYRGLDIPPEDVRRVGAMVRGTELQADYDQLIEARGKIASLLNMEPEAASREIERMRNEATTLEDQNLVDLLAGAHAKSMQERNERPVEWARTTGGGEMATRLWEVDGGLGNVGAVSAVLTDRRDVLDAMARKGTVMPRPLDESEANTMKLYLSKLDYNDRAQYLGAMHNALGDKYFNGAMSQVFADDNAMLAAANYEGRGLRTQAGGSVGAMVLSGRDVLKQNPNAIAAGGEPFDAAFDRLVGSAIGYNRNDRAVLREATMSIYADLAAKANKIGQPLDPELMGKALALSSGGIYERAGQKVLKPYGLPDDQFEARIDAALPVVAKMSGLPESALSSLPLLPTGKEGVYILANGGRPVSQGRRQIALDLTGPAPKVYAVGK